jgi:hypothetical protein
VEEQALIEAKKALRLSKAIRMEPNLEIIRVFQQLETIPKVIIR